MNQQTAAQQTQALTSGVTQLLAKKAELSEQLDNINEQLRAMRNALQGVVLGQRLEREVIAEKAAQEANPTPTE
jgi:predicted  nucleic acid-binding Zn-ribbon protein